MTPHNEKGITPSDYQQAEKSINQALANMEEQTHIEYGSIILRNDKPTRFKWFKRILQRFKNQ
jgi:hypothetical protein